MTTYRVGEAGATVFNEKAEAIATLRPGTVVVEGRVSVPGSLADQYKRGQRKEILGKRLQGYRDKKLRPAEDK